MDSGESEDGVEDVLERKASESVCFTAQCDVGCRSSKGDEASQKIREVVHRAAAELGPPASAPAWRLETWHLIGNEKT